MRLRIALCLADFLVLNIGAINSQQLSFVLQGPIFSQEARTYLCESIGALRRLFPQCEVIVVSWKGTEAAMLGADKTVLLDDPGDLIAHAAWWNRFRFRNKNTRRLLVSSFAGVCESTRLYCVKLRTDASLKSDALLGLINRLAVDQIDPSALELSRHTVFLRRLLVVNAFSRNPRRSPALYHLSDIFIAGLRVDCVKLFSTALGWIGELERSNPDRLPWLCPEQYLWWPNLCGNEKLSLNYGFSYSVARVRHSELSILANAEVVSVEALGLEFSKEFGSPVNNCYTTEEVHRYRNHINEFGYFISLVMASMWTQVAGQLSLIAKAASEKLLKRRGFI